MRTQSVLSGISEVIGVFDDGTIVTAGTSAKVSPSSAAACSQYSNDFGKTWNYYEHSFTKTCRLGAYLIAFPGAYIITSDGIEKQITGLDNIDIDSTKLSIDTDVRSGQSFDVGDEYSSTWRTYINNRLVILEGKRFDFLLEVVHFGYEDGKYCEKLCLYDCYFRYPPSAPTSDTSTSASATLLETNDAYSNSSPYTPSPSVKIIGADSDKVFWRSGLTVKSHYVTYSGSERTIGTTSASYSVCTIASSHVTGYGDNGTTYGTTLTTTKLIDTYCAGYFFSEAAVYNSDLEVVFTPGSTQYAAMTVYTGTVRDCATTPTTDVGYVYNWEGIGVTFTSGRAVYAINPDDDSISIIEQRTDDPANLYSSDYELLNLGNGEFDQVQYAPPRDTPFLVQQLFFVMTLPLVSESHLHVMSPTAGEAVVYKWDTDDFDKIPRYMDKNGITVVPGIGVVQSGRLRPTARVNYTDGEEFLFSTPLKGIAGVIMAYDVDPFIFYLYGESVS